VITRIVDWTFPERLEDVRTRPEAASTLERSPGAEASELARQEEVRLVQRVFLPPGLEARRAVLFAGIEPEDGCAHLCLRAGHALARWTRKPVCVVDADLRSPRLHRLAGTDGEEGLVTAMAGAGPIASFVRRLAPENLWLLPAGWTPDVDSLVMKNGAAACLEELCAQFAHLLISVSPIDMWTEALAADRHVDGVILVLKANVTRREIARHVKQRLEDLEAPLLGVVLNDRTFPIPETIYRAL
jgi:Mrp family chromosome partitioning ATPase